MNKYDKKVAWETIEIAFWKNGVKCREKLNKFFLTRPIYHFHKIMPYQGILIAYCPLHSDDENKLPKDFVAVSCAEAAWKNIKRIVKWGLRYERRNLKKTFKN